MGGVLLMVTVGYPLVIGAMVLVTAIIQTNWYVRFNIGYTARLAPKPHGFCIDRI